jgi:hypothetical protein
MCQLNANQNYNLANITHEMKTPLNGIVGMNELLKNSKLNREQKEYVDIIGECSNQLLGIIDGFFDYTKMMQNKIELNLKPINLRKCIEESYNTILLKADKKNIDLSFIIDDDVPKYIISDKKRLKQIFINILSNAVKFTDCGYIKMSVSCQIIKNDKYNIFFSIEDTGIGIPKNKFNDIFDSFCQINNNDGLGLGLSISKYLVNIMDGEINVNSICGHGATFTFNIITDKYNKKKAPNDKLKVIENKMVLLICGKEQINNYINEFNKINMIPLINEINNIDMIFIDTPIIDNKLIINIKEHYKVPIITTSSIRNLHNNNMIDYKITKPLKQNQLVDICYDIIKNNEYDYSNIKLSKNINILIIDGINLTSFIIKNMIYNMGNKNVTISNKKISNLLKNNIYDIVFLSNISEYHRIQKYKDDFCIVLLTDSKNNKEYIGKYKIDYFLPKSIKLSKLKNIISNIENSDKKKVIKEKLDLSSGN